MEHSTGPGSCIYNYTHHHSTKRLSDNHQQQVCKRSSLLQTHQVCNGHAIPAAPHWVGAGIRDASTLLPKENGLPGRAAWTQYYQDSKKQLNSVMSITAPGCGQEATMPVITATGSPNFTWQMSEPGPFCKTSVCVHDSFTSLILSLTMPSLPLLFHLQLQKEPNYATGSLSEWHQQLKSRARCFPYSPSWGRRRAPWHHHRLHLGTGHPKCFSASAHSSLLGRQKSLSDPSCCLCNKALRMKSLRSIYMSKFLSSAFPYTLIKGHKTRQDADC